MKKYNWKKLIKVILISGLIGGIVGRMLGSFAEQNISNDILSIVVNFLPYLFVIATISGVISLIAYFYFNAKLKTDNYSNDENSFYEKNETIISIMMTCATTCAIINFTAFGMNIFNEDSPFYLFFINVIISFIGEVLYMSLIKKVRPELNADPLEMQFKKHYLDTLDEFEKQKIGKASYNTITSMTFVYIALFCISYCLCLVFNISTVICAPIGLIWFIQTILLTYFSAKEDKKK